MGEAVSRLDSSTSSGLTFEWRAFSHTVSPYTWLSLILRSSRCYFPTGVCNGGTVRLFVFFFCETGDGNGII